MMELGPGEFKILRDHIHQVCGINLSEEKYYLIQQRLEPVIESTGVGGFSGLIQKLVRDRDISFREIVIEAITTNETSFFRDGHPFSSFTEFVLPELGKRITARKTGLDIRKGPKVAIWCAASSTGQEPYSIGILVHEYAMANRHRGIDASDFSILATDISKSVLSRAMTGKFDDMEVSRGISPEMREKYFRKVSGGWMINDKIQNMVEFRKVNLTETFTMLGGFDVILCRNVLIYFDDQTKSRIFEQFRQTLSTSGFLILGACESLNMLSKSFETVRVNESLIYQVKDKSKF